MRFLFSNVLVAFGGKHIQIGNSYLHYEANTHISERELLIESDEIFVIGDVNPGFNSLIAANPALNTIEVNINQLTNGYILFLNRQTQVLTLYTDVFGFYHIFYIQNSNNLVISSEFQDILKFSEKVPDGFALLDIVLFNYTLLERTIIKDIKRFNGGTKILLEDNSFSIKVCFNYADNFRLKKTHRITHKDFANELVKSINKNLVPSIPNYISMTGGFDSRAILAACKQINLEINTFTFGQYNNIESETIKPFILQFVCLHKFIELDKNYIANIDTVFQNYLNKNIENPAYRSLVEFEYTNEFIPPSNIIAGFMGGELVNGQSIGAQAMVTNFASELLLTNSQNFNSEVFFNKIKQSKFLNHAYIHTIWDSYIDTIKVYLSVGDNLNILKFVINEVYSKLFGAVNNVYRNKSSLVVPFMDTDFLDMLLNSNISFLHKTMFKDNPFLNFNSKVLYAKAINYLYPEFSITRFDRLYRVKDLCLPYLWPKAAYFYYMNHKFRKNNKMYQKTTDYDAWYKQIVLSTINNDSLKLIYLLPNIELSGSDFDQQTSLEKREILKLAAYFQAIKKAL